MNCDPVPGRSTLVDKGKRRAVEPTEQTPLLSESGSQSSDRHASASLTRRRLLSKLLYVFFVSMSLCVFAVVILVLVAWSYASKASGMSPDDIMDHAIVYGGPYRFDVLNTTSSGDLWANVEGRIGVDAGSVIGVNSADDSVFRSIWKSLGRWGIQQLDSVTVNPSTVRLTSTEDSSLIFASVELPPVEVTLTSDPPSDLTWLQAVSIPVLITPTSNSTLLLRLLQDSWKLGVCSVRVSVNHVDLTGGSIRESGWRQMLRTALSNVVTTIHVTSECTIYYRLLRPHFEQFPGYRDYQLQVAGPSLLCHSS